MAFKLEVIAYNISSCLIAQLNGADRVELCDNSGEGGTTGSYGFIQSARKKLQIELFPIIRPRGGDFLYDNEEFRIMQIDTRACKDLGCDGMVTGLLNRDGRVDKERVARLVQLAYPMSVTFHRAFDRAVNPFDALEDIIETGCERVLTSGQRPAVADGMELVKQLVQQAGQRIIVMPGSGVRADNIEVLIEQTGASEFHTSASTIISSTMDYHNDHMQEKLDYIECDGEEVKRIRSILAALY